MLTAINVAVEIFVIKMLSVLSLVVIFVTQRWQEIQNIVFAQMPKDLPPFGCKNRRNPQLLAE
jgi:hypothetical protein